MAEENKKVPAFVFKTLPLTTKGYENPDNGVKIKLDCAEPVKTGTTQYGEWYMWFGFVENQNVEEGRKPNVKQVKDYTGKVLFFPTAILNEQLVKAANGKVGAEVRVHRLAEQGAKGLITKYTVEKLSDGEETGKSLAPSETRLITDAEGLIRSGFNLTEEDFVKASQEPQYEGKISSLRAKELYGLLNR